MNVTITVGRRDPSSGDSEVPDISREQEGKQNGDEENSKVKGRQLAHPNFANIATGGKQSQSPFLVPQPLIGWKTTGFTERERGHRVNTVIACRHALRARLFVAAMKMDFARGVLRRAKLCAIAVVGLLLLIASAAIAQDQPKKSAEPVAPGETVFQTVFPSVQAAPPAPVPKTGEAQPDTALRIGSGDLIETNVYNVPDLNTKARVGSNGDIYLPLVDYVHVAGLTPEEAAGVIEKRYADGGFLKDPHVTLLVDEYESQGVSILGEVVKPGVYPALGGQRLLDLISAAGGYSDKAGHSITITHRATPDKPVTVPFSRNATDGDNNVDVWPGDMIIVHRADIVYVVGEVGRPSGFLMDTENLTVLKALALAGGTTHTAKLNGARIIRHGPNGLTEMPIELKKMLEAKAQDIPMQADDILFVPSSAVKALGGRSLDVGAQLATAASIVAIH